MKHQSKYLSYSSKQRKSQLFMEILNEINLYSSCSSVLAFVIASATLQFFTNMNLNYFTGDTNSFTSGKRSEKFILEFVGTSKDNLYWVWEKTTGERTSFTKYPSLNFKVST